jgi:hypothetical protein
MLFSRAYAEALEPKAVGHDEDGRQRHGRGGEDGVEEAERGQRDDRDVVAERPHEVHPDSPERGTG